MNALDRRSALTLVAAAMSEVMRANSLAAITYPAIVDEAKAHDVQDAKMLAVCEAMEAWVDTFPHGLVGADVKWNALCEAVIAWRTQ